MDDLTPLEKLRLEQEVLGFPLSLVTRWSYTATSPRLVGLSPPMSLPATPDAKYR